jgi:hypothetical protein
VLIGQRVFSRRTLEKRPFPLKACIAHTTLPCANALACDLKSMLARSSTGKSHIFGSFKKVLSDFRLPKNVVILTVQNGNFYRRHTPVLLVWRRGQQKSG